MNKAMIYPWRIAMTILLCTACCLGMAAFCDSALAQEKPAKVAKVTASSVSKHSVRLSWKKAKGAKKYQVLRSTSKNGAYKRIATTAKRTFTAKSLKAGKTYYFKVRAIRGKIKGRASQPVRVKTKGAGSRSNANNAGNSDTYGSNDGSGSTSNSHSEAEKMLAMINAERAKHGVAPLQLSQTMTKLAQQKAQDMHDQDYFSHESPTLGSVSDQLKSVYLSFSSCGENIAQCWGGRTEAMNLWMNSEKHRANILNSAYSYVGIGCYNGNWVQQFACLSGASETVHVMDCTSCGKAIYAASKNSYPYYSTDASGHRYGLYQCRYCYELIEKCPKCTGGFFKPAGLTEFGSVAKRCNACGNEASKACVTNCPSCGTEVLGGTVSQNYTLTFTSYKEYNPAKRYFPSGVYFQQFGVTAFVCKTCGCIAHIDSYGAKIFNEQLEKIKPFLKDGTDVLDCIFWEKAVGQTYLGNNTYRVNYEVIDSPRVTDLNALLGKVAP